MARISLVATALPLFSVGGRVLSQAAASLFREEEIDCLSQQSLHGRVAFSCDNA